MEVFYCGEFAKLKACGEKLTLEYRGDVYDVVKLDERYIIDEKHDITGSDAIIYPASFIKKNNEIFKKIEPYLEFINTYLREYDHITFCDRCYFNIFQFMAEDNHGGWYAECDGYPIRCESIYEKYEVECQWCDYGLCEKCSAGTFDEENLEFNILRNAIVLAAGCMCEFEEFDSIILDFPSEVDHIPRIIDWLKLNWSAGARPPADKEESYTEAWTFSESYDMERCRKYLESLY
jgi:hypothetical protein